MDQIAPDASGKTNFSSSMPSGATAPDAAAAEARITALKTDNAFAKRFASGDPEARAEMTRLHHTAYGDPAAPAPDPATTAYEAQFPKAAQPHEFDLPAYTGLPDREAREADKTTRGWLTEAGLGRDHGRSLINAIDQDGGKYLAMSPDERQKFKAEQRTMLQALPGWGSDTEKRLGAIGDMVDNIEKRQPGLVKMLSESGALFSARVLTMLGVQADYLANHPKNRKK